MVKSLFNETPTIANHFDEDERLALVNGDSFAFSKSLPANLFSLIISSPPYNIGKEYEERLALR